MKPEVLAWFYKRPKLVLLPDGKLLGLYVNKGGSQQQLRAIPSEDTGKTWGDHQALVSLPMDEGRWGGCESLVDSKGELQVFLLNDRVTGVFVDPAGEEDAVRLSSEDRKLDI